MNNNDRIVKTDGNRTVYIRKDNGQCSIAEGHYWLPGIYADEAAAWAAFDLPDEVLAVITHYSLRGIGDDYRPMTLDEIRAELQVH